MGGRSARGSRGHAQPRNGSGGARAYRQARQADPHHRPGRAPPSPAPEDPGRHHPQVPPPEAGVAAALATAADQRGGHGPRLGRRGEDVRRRLRLDLQGRRAAADLTSVAQQSARRPDEDALARLDHGRAGGRRRRRAFPAGTQLRPRRGTRSSPAAGAAPGQAQARQRSPVPGQPVRGVRRLRRARWDCGPSGGESLAGHPPGQRQPRCGGQDAQVRLARHHRAPLPHRRRNRRGPTPPGLEGHPAPLRPHLSRGQGALT